MLGTLAGVLLAVGLTLPPASARAQPQVGLLGDLVHSYTVSPGQTVEGLLVLTSSSDRPQEVRLYLQDYGTDGDGRPAYSQPGHRLRSNAGWIRLGQERVVVPPGQQLAVAYTIQVPADASLSGTYWSVLMVEPAGAEALVPPNSGGGRRVAILQVWRYAVHIITDIGATGDARLTFVRPRLMEEQGGLVLQVDLVNDGQRWLRPRVWLEVYDQEGALAARAEAPPPRLYPGDVSRQRLALGSLAPGSYQALLVADNGDAHVFAVRYTFTVRTR